MVGLSRGGDVAGNGGQVKHFKLGVVECYTLSIRYYV